MGGGRPPLSLHAENGGQELPGAGRVEDSDRAGGVVVPCGEFSPPPGGSTPQGTHPLFAKRAGAETSVGPRRGRVVGRGGCRENEGGRRAARAPCYRWGPASGRSLWGWTRTASGAVKGKHGGAAVSGYRADHLPSMGGCGKAGGSWPARSCSRGSLADPVLPKVEGSGRSWTADMEVALWHADRRRVRRGGRRGPSEG